jgi:CubicO group peptidase (beta-lactamase class C family)
MKNLVWFMIFMSAFFPGVAAQDTRYERQVKTLLEDLREVTHVPAFSVAAVHRGKLVAAVASGTVNAQSQEKATSNHLFRLASVSKVVGATMLAELAMQNKLDVDGPIGQYYPQLDRKYHDITMRQLMAHISGMPHYQAKDIFIDRTHYDSATEAVVTLKGRNLLTEPGMQYHYSSHGYTLAGAIYEQITGHALEDSLPQFIKAYSGRKSPLIEDVTRRNPQRSGLFERDGDKVVPASFNDKSYCVFGAGLSATAPDLAFLGQAVLERAKAIPELHELLFTPVHTKTGEATGRPLYEVAFGWRVGKDASGRTVYHHAGVTPGARSVIVLYPEEEFTLVFLSNSSWVSQIERTAFALARLYLESGIEDMDNQNAVFDGFYEDEAMTGHISCQAEQCWLNDERGPLSKGIGRFNPTLIHGNYGQCCLIRGTTCAIY